MLKGLQSTVLTNSTELTTDYLDWYTPEEGQSAQKLKHCDKNNKNKDNNLNVNCVNDVKPCWVT